MKKHGKNKQQNDQKKERITSMFYNVIPTNYGRQQVQSVYTHTRTPECSRVFMTGDAFRVLLRSMGGGCKGGSFRQEDAVELYGFRVREKDGTIAVVITDVVESSPAAKRSGCTFDVDNDYSTHRDRYIRDRHTNSNFSLVGYIHSHPGHMTQFSQQDKETMAMYAPEMKVFVSGLITLYNGELECTMYVCTWENGRLMIWDAPFLVSDEEARKRLPNEKKKEYDAIWKDATGSCRMPRLCMLETSMEEMMGYDQRKRQETAEVKTGYTIDVSGIPEGTEALVCGTMVNGKLKLFLKPMTQQAEPEQEADAAVKPVTVKVACEEDKPVPAEVIREEEQPADASAESVQEQQPVQEDTVEEAEENDAKEAAPDGAS